MQITRVSRIYTEWRAGEEFANSRQTEGELSAVMRNQRRLERRLAVARCETLTDMAMKLVALSAEGTCAIGEYLETLVDEAKEIIGRTPHPGRAQERAKAERAA